MINKALPRGSKRRKTANLFMRPFLRPIIRIMHIKVFGKQLFINRYTKKIPGLDIFIRIIEQRTILHASSADLEKDYKKWLKHNFPKEKQLTEQRKIQKKFNTRPLISVLVPTYNTDLEHLEACIQSVVNQTYDNWEMCIADDASSDEEVRNIIKKFTDQDSRIKYVFRKENGHICRASNSALKLAKGKYIALLDHDDILWPNALFEVVNLINHKKNVDFIYTDEDKIDDIGKKHMGAFFKPEWSPEFLRSVNYITHFAVIKKTLVGKVGGFRPGYEGAQDWDLFLRVTRLTDNIYHIPKVLYSWRKSENSTAQRASAKNYAFKNQKKVLRDDIMARGLSADLDWQVPYLMWKVAYKVIDKPLVSIVIPTKNQYDFIKQCLNSIHQKTTYKNFEVVIVDTGSTDKKIWDLYKEYEQFMSHMKVVKWAKTFNFASVCNFGAEKSNGDYLLFLNNDTEIISPNWIQDMLGYAQQDDIGAVGCKLYYPDKKLQHAGIILGVGGQNDTPGIAGHFFPAYIDQPPQTPSLPLYVGGTRNFTAVTAACVMVSKEKFYAVKGFDAKFRIAFNDVDFCLKLYKRGWRNVYLPHVELYHYESISVGQPGSKQRDLVVFSKEINLMLEKWKKLIDNDPYFHPEFRKDIANARLKISK